MSMEHFRGEAYAYQQFFKPVDTTPRLSCWAWVKQILRVVGAHADQKATKAHG